MERFLESLRLGVDGSGMVKPILVAQIYNMRHEDLFITRGRVMRISSQEQYRQELRIKVLVGYEYTQKVIFFCLEIL